MILCWCWYQQCQLCYLGLVGSHDEQEGLEVELVVAEVVLRFLESMLFLVRYPQVLISKENY